MLVGCIAFFTLLSTTCSLQHATQ